MINGTIGKLNVDFLWEMFNECLLVKAALLLPTTLHPGYYSQIKRNRKGTQNCIGVCTFLLIQLELIYFVIMAFYFSNFKP